MRRFVTISVVLATAFGVFVAPAEARLLKAKKNNTTVITIPASGNATPFPSTITVGGRLGRSKVKDVNVILRGVSHTFPDDLDILVIHDGRGVVLISDVGGGVSFASAEDYVDETFVIDDEASGTIPDSTNSGGGRYRTSDIGGDGWVIPPPDSGASFSGGGDGLAWFNGQRARGDWNLYVRDDTGPNDAGQIAGGWSIQLTVKTRG